MTMVGDCRYLCFKCRGLVIRVLEKFQWMFGIVIWKWKWVFIENQEYLSDWTKLKRWTGEKALW